LKVVSIISGDKAKTQAYCQIANLGGQIDQAAQEKDEKKAEALIQRINEGFGSRGVFVLVRESFTGAVLTRWRPRRLSAVE
jgi:hypothetical protein